MRCEVRNRIVHQGIQKIGGIRIRFVIGGERERANQQLALSSVGLYQDPNILIDPAVKHSRKNVFEFLRWDSPDDRRGRGCLGFKSAQRVESDFGEGWVVLSQPEEMKNQKKDTITH